MEKVHVKCSNCGGNLKFIPEIFVLKCESCESETQLDSTEAKLVSIDFKDFYNKGFAGNVFEEISMITCHVCGANTVFDEHIISDACSFCTSHLSIADLSKSTCIKPSGILPFSIDKNTASEAFRKWVASRWFAPKDLIETAKNPEKLTGIYLPFWIFHAETNSKYKGERGEYEILGSSGRQYMEWEDVSGSMKNKVKDIIVPASHSINAKYLEALNPWNLEGIVTPEHKFLNGFKAENYQLSPENGFLEAKTYMNNLILINIKNKIGGDAQKISALNTDFSIVKFNYVLMPVWLSSFKYNEKLYQFVINASTAEVQGEHPKSTVKIAFFISVWILTLCVFVYFTIYGGPAAKITVAILTTIIVLGLLFILKKKWQSEI